MGRFRRLIRVAITASLVLALWAIARPANAATASLAPFCDDRGATAVASPPVLPMLEQPFLRASPSPDRADGEVTPHASIGPNRSLPEIRSFEVTPFLAARPHLDAEPPAESILVLRSVIVATPQGVHVRVERPPRPSHTRAAK